MDSPIFGQQGELVALGDPGAGVLFFYVMSCVMWFVLLCGELARFARERKGPAFTKDLLGKSCFLNEFLGWASNFSFFL